MTIIVKSAALLSALLALALGSPTVRAEDLPSPAAEKEVMAAMDAWIQATSMQDTKALERLLHDELVYSHSDTRIQTKAEVIKDVADGRGPAGVELSETTVRVYGTTALVRARVVVKGRPRPRPAGAATPAAAPRAAGQAPAPPLLILHVLVKGAQGWQVVSRQATRPPATAAN